ncbi:MAG TPA: hypothetical protein VIK58_05410 [Caldimonas sp.]
MEMPVAEDDATGGVEQHEAGLENVEHLLLQLHRRFGPVERTRQPARQHQHEGQQRHRYGDTDVAVAEYRRQARARPVPERQQQQVCAGQDDGGHHHCAQQRTQGPDFSVHAQQ